MARDAARRQAPSPRTRKSVSLRIRARAEPCRGQRRTQAFDSDGSDRFTPARDHCDSGKHLGSGSAASHSDPSS